MDNVKADAQTAQLILNRTQALITKFGPRVTGTQACRAAAAELASHLRGFCDSAREEEFGVHPGSLFHFGRILSLSYIASLCLLAAGGVFVVISAGVYLLAMVFVTAQILLYTRLFDGLFRKKPGCNAVGVVEPQGGVKRQIIVAGHHDSAYIYTYLERFGRLAGLVLLPGLAFCLLMLGLNAAALAGVLGGAAWRLSGAWLVAALAGLLFTVPLFFFISRQASPGAGDNLVSSYLAAEVGAYFAAQKKLGAGLAGTRLILLSTDGEEAAMRGAMAYADKHADELKAIPTMVLNIDSIYKVKDLSVLVSDRHGLVRLSMETADACAGVAQELGYKLTKRPTPFGSGTDALAFARKGVKSVSIIGMPATMFADTFVYHTRRDTVDAVEPEAVQAVYEIILSYIQKADKGG